MERDRIITSSAISGTDFNSHAHVERDGDIFGIVIFTCISTHTLTWSVTTIVGGVPHIKVYFNSHAHVERDAADMKNAGIKRISTHTLTWSVTG